VFSGLSPSCFVAQLTAHRSIWLFELISLSYVISNSFHSILQPACTQVNSAWPSSVGRISEYWRWSRPPLHREETASSANSNWRSSVGILIDTAAAHTSRLRRLLGTSTGRRVGVANTRRLLWLAAMSPIVIRSGAREGAEQLEQGAEQTGDTTKSTFVKNWATSV